MSLNKEGLGNIITFHVKSFLSDVKNYLTYGLRAHFVRLVTNIFPNDKVNDKKIAALRFLKNMQGENKSKEFSFKLSTKDIFIALERDDKTEENFKEF